MVNKIRGRNEGSISQRPNGTWRAQVSSDGRRISKGFQTKTEGLTWLRKMQSEVDRGLDVQGGKILLQEYLTQWLEASKVSLRPKTALQYEQVTRKHIVPHIGSIPVNALRLVKVEQFYSTLLLSGVGVRTVRIVHAVLHKALEKTVRYQIISYNPVHGAILPREKHGEMQILDDRQLGQFLIAAKGSRFEAMYYLAVSTGMRQGELFGLKWADLQWQSGTLNIQRQVQKIPGKGWDFEEPKTRAGRRTIKVGESVLQALRVHRLNQELQKASVGARWKDFDLVFSSSIGTPVDRSNLRADFNQVLEKAGIPRIRFHDLRHTAASILLNQGVPVIAVSRRLGHSKPSITLDVYGHLINELDEESARIMDEKVIPIPVDLSTITNQKVGR
jgi:integrase